MENATIIVLLALIQYTWLGMKVGGARGKYKIDAPACSGDENFERIFRTHQNTMEQLVAFIPATFAFAYYLSPTWVLLPGVTFIIGRFLYAMEYTKNPKTRAPGMALTFAAIAVLILGALFGVVKGML